MKPGDITAVSALPRGYQIFKLETMTPAQTMPFEQAREQISERVFTGKRKDEFDKYLVEAAGAGDHRVEEPGRQESVRGGRCRAAESPRRRQ